MHFHCLPNIFFCFKFYQFCIFIFYQTSKRESILSLKIGVEKFCYALHWSWSCGHQKSFKIPVKELLKKVLLQRYFSRILTTKCYLKLESKIRLVHQPHVRRQRFYALCLTFKLALSFSNFYKISLSG